MFIRARREENIESIGVLTNDWRFAFKEYWRRMEKFRERREMRVREKKKKKE